MMTQDNFIKYDISDYVNQFNDNSCVDNIKSNFIYQGLIPNHNNNNNSTNATTLSEGMLPQSSNTSDGSTSPTFQNQFPSPSSYASEIRDTTVYPDFLQQYPKEFDQQDYMMQTDVSIKDTSTLNSSSSSSTTSSSSGKPCKIVNSELRRQIHIQSEQKRRAQIKDGFEDLRNELPSCLNKKMSKVALLHRTVQHIQHLKNTQMTIYAELERLSNENEQLRKFQESIIQKQNLEKMYSSL